MGSDAPVLAGQFRDGPPAPARRLGGALAIGAGIPYMHLMQPSRFTAYGSIHLHSDAQIRSGGVRIQIFPAHAVAARVP
jgi:hypothetical protein